MSEDNTKAAAKLRKLGERVRAGWTKLHPVSEKQLASVRAAVRQQWEQEHAGKSPDKGPETVKRAQPTRGHSAQQARSTKQKRQSKSHDHGHSH